MGEVLLLGTNPVEDARVSSKSCSGVKIGSTDMRCPREDSNAPRPSSKVSGYRCILAYLVAPIIRA